MKITCPKCGRRLAVADSLVPPAGGWARCPQCGERFFLRPPPRASLDPGQQPAPPDIVRDGAARRELLSRLKNPQAPRPEEEEGEVVTIFPRPALRPETGLAAGSLILALVLLAVFYLFRASVPQPPPPPAMAAAREDQGPDESLVRRDLVSLARRHGSRTNLWAVVDYSGPEARIFKYFRHRLVPEDHCPAIFRLELKSAAPAEGLSLFGACLDEDGREQKASPLELRLRWEGRSAFADFPEYRGSFELNLFP